VPTFNHVFETHENCAAPYCKNCEGGLAVCVVCGGTEGSLTTDCPGEKLTSEMLDRIYRGEIDFRFGKWIDLR